LVKLHPESYTDLIGYGIVLVAFNGVCEIIDGSCQM
jgi:hypothetical protein